jgi:hypothetical protein
MPLSRTLLPGVLGLLLLGGPPAAAQLILRADTSLADLRSGKTLNAKLAELREVRAPLTPEPEPAIAVKVLRQINLTRGPDTGNLTVLREADRLRWPATLQDGLKMESNAVRISLSRAVREARLGKVGDRVLKDLDKALDALLKALLDKVDDLTPSQYIESRRFITALQQGRVALRRKDVGDDLRNADALVVRARTVPELVRFLSTKKLQFAPAGLDGDAAYREVLRAFEAFARRAKAGR